MILPAEFVNNNDDDLFEELNDEDINRRVEKYKE